jgi:hypothetical protein
MVACASASWPRADPETKDISSITTDQQPASPSAATLSLSLDGTSQPGYYTPGGPTRRQSTQSTNNTAQQKTKYSHRDTSTWQPLRSRTATEHFLPRMDYQGPGWNLQNYSYRNDQLAATLLVS